MSNQSAITSEAQLQEAARTLWPEGSALTWRWKKAEAGRDRDIDAICQATLDGRGTTFLVEFKLNPGARDVESLAERKGQKSLLLIAPRISESLAQLCRDKGISCADLNGRVWLRAKGLLVDRSPTQKPSFRSAITPPDLFSPKSSRLVRSLLNRPDYLWTRKELIERTRLSKGLVSRLVQHLVDEGIVQQGKVTLSVQRPAALLDAWAAQDEWRKRTTIRQYSLLEVEPEEIARRVARVYPDDEQPAFTQWFAANLRRPYTIPPAVSAYVPFLLNEWQEKELNARRVSDGGSLWLIAPKDAGVFRETQRVAGFALACDAQIYLDLLKVGLRGPEQAKALREWEGFGKPSA